MVSYNVIVGDTVTQVVGRILLQNGTSPSVLLRREVISLATSIFLTLPLSLYRYRNLWP